MMPSRLPVVISFSMALLFSLATISPAQTIKTIYNFDGTVGSTPVSIGLTQGRDGDLYGTTVYGGTYGMGAVFKITPSGHITALHSFSGTDGSYPWSGLTLGADGNFYSTATDGGTGYGVLYKMTPTGILTVLHNFNYDGTDGILPNSAPTLASDGNFYGTTLYGGINGAGTVYKFTPAGSLTIIFSFDELSTGYSVSSAPTQGNDGNLYVPSTYGGTNQCGSLIKISTSGTLVNTFVFDCGANGAIPNGSFVKASDGNLYDTTFSGGAYSKGVLFKLAPNFAYTAVYSFGATTTDGTEPPAGVIQATDGNLYGLDYGGGASNYGTIYDYSLNGTYAILYSWDHVVDVNGQLFQHTNGILYGETSGAGTHNLGTLFGFNVGLAPFAALVQYQGRAGSAAQILGQGFTGTTSVTFNGVPATSFKVVSNTYMTAVIPTGATSGPVVVTTPSGTLKSNKNFRIIP